jgi:CRISPR-associated protein Cas4
MPFLGFYCAPQKKTVTPRECLAHAIEKRTELLSMGCDQSPEILRNVVESIEQETTQPPNTWRVTQVISCPRKVRLSQVTPYTQTPQQCYWMYRGTMIHALVNGSRLAGEALFAEKRLSSNIGGAVLTGQPDLVLRGGHLVDFKSTEWVPKQASEHHVQQLSVYAWLLDQNATPIQSAEITYITMRETIRRLVELAPLTDTARFLRERIKLLTQKSLPRYEKCWECKYCPVEERCLELASVTKRRRTKPVTRPDLDW